ncbi:MAG: hypothetical protein HFH68_03450 [Lachnospiraceae bacterium]|nr:hypothetical protein [Lachnospiraceae bacterium]
MIQVFVKYNPYRLQTVIKVNGNEIETDSTLYKVVKGKRLQEWVGKFPEMLKNELNSCDFDIEFYGMDLDWDDFEDSFKNAQNTGTVNNINLRFIEGKSDDDIKDKIVSVFKDLTEGPVEDFKDPKLLKAFKSIDETVFPINVIATMSSGKSTLINSLLQKRLMPSKNEACTAIITEILDNSDGHFSALAYNHKGEIIKDIPELTYEIMDELNSNNDVHKISTEGDIPFLDSKSTALMLVDTPGPNNSQNQAHKNTTYSAISNGSNSLILYVLNGTQLSTNDDASLLRYVAEQIQKGGKQVRDRFLFVINKMDGFNPEVEDIEKAVLSVKKYLAEYGIEDPQLFPCSAYTALNIRTYFNDIDIKSINDLVLLLLNGQLPLAAGDTVPMIRKFIEFETMHLEKYSTLSPSAQRELNYKLDQAEKNNDIKEQALIHCGIYSIEAAITAYVKKYAKTKKVKDLVESFQEVLESNQTLGKAKEKIATDEKAAKECIERAEAVKARIADGKEAAKFKEKIETLNPMEVIKNRAKKLRENAIEEIDKLFGKYPDEVITERSVAIAITNQFAIISSDSIAKLAADMEGIIDKELVKTGEEILLQYQDKLSKFDKETAGKHLDFNTVDLIKGALTNMQENTEAWCSDSFASETVNSVGEVKYEEKTYYEKVGQEEEEIVVGSHEEKIGTKKVKAGTERVQVERTGLFHGIRDFFSPKYEERDVYKTEDVYKTVLDYDTVLRDIFEEKTERIEKFSITIDDIHVSFVAKFRQNIDDGIDNALKYSEEQVTNMKKQFMEIFDELDGLISKKYDELEKCASDQKTKEEELEKSRKLLQWMETCKAEIDEILDM